MLRCVFLVSLAIVAVARAAVSGSVDVLLVAGPAELQPLIEKLTHAETENFGAWSIWRGTLGGKTVALARSEGDPLNAVAATTFAIRRCPPRLVITFGSARAFDEALRPGDVIVAERFVAMDGMISPVTAVGEGSHPLQWKRLPHALMTSGEKEIYLDSFPGDAAALNVVLKLGDDKVRIARGVLGSTAQIIREADRIAHLRSLWHASTDDNESAFVAGCATLFGCPVTGFRIIDGSPADAAKFATKLLENLP